MEISTLQENATVDIASKAPDVSIQESQTSFEVPWLSCIIPTYGSKGIALTRTCITTLQKTHQHILPEVLVCSDGDEYAELEALKSMAQELHFGLIRIDRRGFATACNTGLKLANGQYGAFLLNNDLEFTEGPALQVLADAMISMGAGIIGTRLLYPNRTIQHAGIVFVPTPNGSNPGYFDHYLRGEYENHADAVVVRRGLVTGACLGINRAFIERSGYLDERFGFTCEDVDLCMRAFECGMPSMYCGYPGGIIHHEGASRGRTLEEKMAMEPEIAKKEQDALAFLFRKWIGVGFEKFSVHGQATHE